MKLILKNIALFIAGVIICFFALRAMTDTWIEEDDARIERVNQHRIANCEGRWSDDDCIKLKEYLSKRS